MDTLEWSLNLAVRNKEPIVTVREILQDSDVEEQTPEPSSSRSPRKRNHCEVEKNSYFTPSIRKPSSEKEQVSPAKRHRSGPGLGSIDLESEHDLNSRGTVLVESWVQETITTTSKNGKEKKPDTPRFGRRSGSSKLVQPELSTSPASPSEHSRLGSSTTVFENSRSHNSPNNPELFQSKTYNLENSYNNVCDNTFEGPSSKVQEPENKCQDIPKDKEAENDYEFIANTFKSLYPLVEDWIHQQKSQLDTVTERINRILGCLQKGERLQQQDPTIEMASQLEDLIDDITNGITPESSINDSKPRDRYCQKQRHFVDQLQAVFMTTEASLCLDELVKFADIRSTMIGLTEKDVEFINTIEQLNTSHRKAIKELHMRRPRDTIEYSLILDTSHREYTNLSKMIMALKEEMSAFYKY
ncbi:68b4a9c2-6971-4be2-b8a2-cae69f91cb85 [Sclerotinia trifoliorum]|uniref:68b4a9c2-6971-4be2-b8a2-cae69f91cb85 n=1 Tax=Sclerotinia trifoliorum TaxID=28548 RepID=A0A8H2VP48_9HELO|nr:68b4a9c2-6971-4be2-b8a2-cae69f91cb85 [Sclerotinia trifoliorum]